MDFNRNFTWLLNALVIFIFMELTACFYPMGDSYIFIEGEIKTNKNIPLDDCKLQMYMADDDVLIQEKEIGLVIKTSAIINPYYKGDYYIKILCGDYSYNTENINIPDTRYYDSPLKLGEIKLTKKLKNE